MTTPRYWLTARSAFIALSLVLALRAPGTAGVRDKPAPDTPDREKTKIIYRMGAVYYDPGAADTTVTCRNLGPKSVHLALELFDENDAPSGKIARAKLATDAAVTFSTSATTSMTGRVVVVGDLPPIEHGKARVSAPQGDIACTALVHLRGPDGEIRQLPLALIKRVTPTHETDRTD